MIKNDRQFGICKAQLDRLLALRREMGGRPIGDSNEAKIRDIEIAAVDSQVSELEKEVSDYVALRSGQVPVGELTNLDQLPDFLIRSRIAQGLTQKDLATRLGLKEQQIQRYEATSYKSANLRRLLDVARGLNVQVHALASLSAHIPKYSEVVNGLKRIGIDRDFITKRIAPTDAHVSQPGAKVTLDMAARLGLIFGWKPTDILNGLTLRPARPAFSMSYKLPSRVNPQHVAAYTVYVQYLARTLIDATPDLKAHRLVRDPEAIRSTILKSYGAITFKTALNYVWEQGIATIPLRDPGTFHAATVRVNSRNVIVLKQSTRLASRWLFDLFHEIYHALSDPTKSDNMVIDAVDPAMVRTDVKDELEANRFAGTILLGEGADTLARECAEMAGGSVERLKGIVPTIARKEGLDEGLLANYLAHRLAQQGINWWGAATNLQHVSDDPWAVARDVLLERTDLRRLNELDRELVTRALSEA